MSHRATARLEVLSRFSAVLLGAVAIVALAIASILAVAAAKPNEIEITRQTTIKAPPERVFTLIDDFHNWKEWAPQDVGDPTFTRTFSGASRGTGAVSDFRGSQQSGEGRMEIVDSTEPSRVTVIVDFRRPFVAHNTNQFTLLRDGEVTWVTWTMRGTNPFIAKVMGVFIDMKAAMDRHFETGLANLKAAAEGRSTRS
jgi:uncharacterized protein YndB with AHSA1/START domain